MRLRRSTSTDLRLDLTPLIDVVFLLLTYFIFAMILMIRADVLDINLPKLGSAERVDPGVTITVTIDAAGSVYVNGEPASVEALAGRIESFRAEAPEAAVLVAVDPEGASGAFLRVVDAFVSAGVTNYRLLGQPVGGAGDGG